MAWSDQYEREAQVWRQINGADSIEAAAYDRLREQALEYESRPRVKHIVCPTCHEPMGALHLKGCDEPFAR